MARQWFIHDSIGNINVKACTESQLSLYLLSLITSAPGTKTPVSPCFTVLYLDKSLPMPYLQTILDYLQIPWIIQVEPLRSCEVDTCQLSRHKENYWKHKVSCFSSFQLTFTTSCSLKKATTLFQKISLLPLKVFFFL